MAKDSQVPDSRSAIVTLVVQRVIRATPERLFDGWTQPDQLRKWWGPASVICTAAEVNLRIGGKYRIANQFPDGKVLWIFGEFEVIQRPNLLVYTWQLSEAPAERVTVRFLAQGESTKIVVTHERIASAAARDQHEQGWLGCLEGLDLYLGESKL